MEKLLEKAEMDSSTEAYFILDLVEEISEQLWNLQKNITAVWERQFVRLLLSFG